MIGAISSRQTIYSLLWLIVSFISGALVFFNAGANMVGLILIIVYVGAIGMFFLFMIMLLDIKGESLVPSTVGDVGMFFVGCGVFEFLYDVKIFEVFWMQDLGVGNGVFSNDLASIAVLLYDCFGWSLIVLSLVLFKAMLIAVDIANFEES